MNGGRPAGGVGHLEIEVLPPRKSETLYEFRCVLRASPRSARDALRAARALLAGDRFARRSTLRFGFEAVNHPIRHDACWDSLYPLMYLTRNGGPLFGRFAEATLVFRYPILSAVRDFYVRRAAAMGLRIDVQAPTSDAVARLPTEGHVLAFGGGKESRMLLGALRELGRDPLVVTSGAENAPDLPGARVTRTLSGVQADRVMPALMSLGRHLYYGSGLAGAYLHEPWQQYFDWGSPRALAELSALLGALGVEMQAHAPAVVLPYNLAQRILFERYPDLYRHQRSVEREERSRKNLHVALCKLHHGIPFEDHCSEALFAELAAAFVEEQLARPDDFGFRRHEEVVIREMRAILHARRDDPRLAALRGRIPSSWEGAWIDRVHSYASPGLEAGFASIYRAHAEPLDEGPACAGAWRVPV